MTEERYYCCDHCVIDSDGACGDGVDNHGLPCPEDCFIGTTLVEGERSEVYPYPHKVRSEQ